MFNIFTVSFFVRGRGVTVNKDNMGLDIRGVFLSLLTAAVREKQSHPRLTLLHN